jgi:hypothetical protein
VKLLPHIAGVCAVFLLAACLPVTSKVPVGSTVGLKPDPALLGTWKARDANGDEPAYVHFIGNNDGTMTALLVSPPQKENLGEWSAYALRVATLGENHIVNAQEVIANGKPSDGPLAQQQVLLLYRATGRGNITLYVMDDKATAAAIKAGAIAGEIDPGENGDVRITAGEPALDNFMRTPQAAKLFGKALVSLTRIE